MDFVRDHDLVVLVIATLVTIGAVGRTSRLLIFDDFPPIVWARVRFLAAFDEDNSWSKIAECPWCLTPWLMGIDMAWAYFSDLAWWWWVPNLWFGMSYAASILIAYDEPPPE